MNHLGRGCTFPGQLIDWNPPELGNILTFFRYIDMPVAWKLVSFLTNGSPTLAIDLPSDHHSAAPWFADVTSSQGEVDAGQAVVHAMGAVLDASRMQAE